VYRARAGANSAIEPVSRYTRRYPRRRASARMCLRIFSLRGPFAAYVDDPNSVFMEKGL
jgi:hypothetical protein